MRFFLLMIASFSFSSLSAPAPKEAPKEGAKENAEEGDLKKVPLSRCLDIRTAPFFELGCGYIGGRCRPAGTVDKSSASVPLYTTFLNGYNQKAYAYPWGFDRGPLKGASFRFTAGWNFVPRNMRIALGFVLGGALTTATLKARYPHLLEKINAPATIEKFSYLPGPHIKIKDKGYFYVAERLGVISGRTFLFTKLGWSMHRISMALNPESPKKIGRSVSCLLAGGGIDFNVTPYMSLGLEGNCHISGKHRYTFSLPNGTYPQISVRTTLLEVLCTVKYVVQTLRR